MKTLVISALSLTLGCAGIPRARTDLEYARNQEARSLHTTGAGLVLASVAGAGSSVAGLVAYSNVARRNEDSPGIYMAGAVGLILSVAVGIWGGWYISEGNAVVAAGMDDK